MENSRESSIWRSLAVAFGDGLAFGVGMALSQKARREGAPPTETTAPEGRLEGLERRLAQMEKAPARLEPKVLETVVSAFESELRQRDEQWTRRMSETIEAAKDAVRSEIAQTNAVASKQHLERTDTLRQDVVADLRSLEAQGIAFQQEVTDAIPRIVEQQIAARMEVRAAELEERLREEVRQAAVRATSLAAETMNGVVERKLGLLRETVAERDREIADLRKRLAETDQRTLDLLSAIGQVCRQAAERMAPPPVPGGEEPGDAVPPVQAEVAPAAAEEILDETPRFQVAPSHPWTLPLVSSLLVASGCLACLHWL